MDFKGFHCANIFLGLQEIAPLVRYHSCPISTSSFLGMSKMLLNSFRKLAGDEIDYFG